jgi:hypothetical protein
MLCQQCADFFHVLSTVGDAILFNSSGTAIPYSPDAHYGRIFSCLVQLLSGGQHLSFCCFYKLSRFSFHMLSVLFGSLNCLAPRKWSAGPLNSNQLPKSE